LSGMCWGMAAVCRQAPTDLDPDFCFPPSVGWSITSVMAADLQTRPSLLLRLREAGDDTAWSQFVAIYTPLIFAFCRGRGLGETDASDVAQEVLKAVAAAIPRFEYDPARSSFRNWLFTVVRSKLNNFLATQARQPRLAGESTLQHFADTEPENGLEETWRREYQTNLVRWAAGQIQCEFKTQTWDAFWRTAIQGQPAEAVAGELGLTLNALYIARSRVTGRLKQMIQSIEEGAATLEGFHG
jgi:RNA polymerase sigma factor (sigma-70 family)